MNKQLIAIAIFYSLMLKLLWEQMQNTLISILSFPLLTPLLIIIIKPE